MSLDRYESVELTPEEISEAIKEGKRKKYFRLKNADYWRQAEEKAKQAYEADKLARRLAGRHTKIA